MANGGPGTWRSRARELKRQLVALAIALRDPRTPRMARILGICVIAYAVSPIDLIPDFIPVLGLLDDVVLLPLAIMLVIRLIPGDVWEASKRRASISGIGRLAASRTGALVIVAVWILAIALVVWGLWSWLA